MEYFYEKKKKKEKGTNVEKLIQGLNKIEIHLCSCLISKLLVGLH